ncbi:uncharacterized protein LOC116220992 isoform X2 [Clupea harengus]|uniref:Uncharacterized protein LOC116220992 isoform X2 n=1 Tax=Clupea harengus TaxID=7950 RepID=A0A6P8FBB2_CLUHA|nr:uncharacterized protein LOC116220992 isoform X2 [Clupea harengus]
MGVLIALCRRYCFHRCMIVMGICHYIISSISLLGFVAMALNRHSCLPVTCLNCNKTNLSNSLDKSCLGLCEGASHSCINVSDALLACMKDFRVWLNTFSTEINKGDNFTVTCEHNLTLDHIEELIWLKDNERVPRQNTRQLTLEDLIISVTVSCKIHSHCGDFISGTMKIDVSAYGSLGAPGSGKAVLVVLLGVCCVIAVALIVFNRDGAGEVCCYLVEFLFSILESME